MKLEVGFGGDYSLVEGSFDFDSAMNWAETHGEVHDWSYEYEYRLTDELSGLVYTIEMGAWFEL